MSKHDEMSDFDLSVELMKAVYGEQVEFWTESDCGKYVYDCGPVGNDFFKADILDVNNWNDIMPIAADNKIAIHFDHHKEVWRARYTDLFNRHVYGSHKESPQRAIAICFLKMMGAENG
jgi:hypothetical protein